MWTGDYIGKAGRDKCTRLFFTRFEIPIVFCQSSLLLNRMIAKTINTTKKPLKMINSVESSCRLAPRSMTPLISLMKWVKGKASAMSWAGRGMPANGKMKPDSRMEGSNMKKLSCMAWNWVLTRVEISRPSARFATINTSVTI